MVVAFHSIQVYPGIADPNQTYKVQWYNPAGYPFLGAGAQGAVFQLSPTTCVKVFVHESDAQQEAHSLYRASSASFTPRVHGVGPDYIIMEYIQGQDMDSFLSEQHHLPVFLAEKLVVMLHEMQRVRFTRRDAALRHIYITPERQLKVIDHVNSYRYIQPYLVKLLQDLANKGCLIPFLECAEKAAPAMSAVWRQTSVIPS